MTKLVEALESDRYQQTDSFLRDQVPVKYCCLGVACDISGVGEWYGRRYAAPDDSSETVLPLDVLDWLGLDDDQYDSIELPVTGDTTAMHMNDGGRSFADIAAAIRKTYLEED
jgi:hypothetical protein